jgi:predicted DCC family thiol-disulfide oxidoreductase YuxK
MLNDNHPIILFDGVCNLCNGAVNSVIRRDPKAQFRFAALQSDVGQKLLAHFRLSTSDFDTFILVEGERYYSKSTAALRVIKGLGPCWSLLYVLIAVPRPVRDFVYRLIARNRYRLFGKQDSCMVPTPDIKARFL